MYRYVFGSLDICTHMHTLHTHTHTRLSSSKASASSQLCQWWSCMAQLRFRTVLWPHHYQIDRCYFLVPLQGSISAQFGELISNNFQRWKWNHSLQFPSPVRKSQLDKPSTKSTCLSCLRLIEWCWKKSGPLESEIGSVLVLQHAQKLNGNVSIQLVLRGWIESWGDRPRSASSLVHPNKQSLKKFVLNGETIWP